MQKYIYALHFYTLHNLSIKSFDFWQSCLLRLQEVLCNLFARFNILRVGPFALGCTCGPRSPVPPFFCSRLTLSVIFSPIPTTYDHTRSARRDSLFSTNKSHEQTNVMSRSRHCKAKRYLALFFTQLIYVRILLLRVKMEFIVLRHARFLIFYVVSLSERQILFIAVF